jgi:hypothetical protein
VKVNGVLIHSKLSTSAFPDFEEVVRIAGEASKGEEPAQVTKTQKKDCTIA